MKFNEGQSTAEIPPVTIRRLGAHDAAAVTRLAQLDTARAPSGELIGAELDGHLVAAISTATGEAISRPVPAHRRDRRRAAAARKPANARPTLRTRLVSMLRPAWSVSSER